MDKVQQYNEVLCYASSVGIRTKNTEANNTAYIQLVKFIFDCRDKGIDSILVMYFIDCVAHNVLGVSIFQTRLYQYNVLLRDKRYPASFIEEYERLRDIRYINKYKRKNSRAIKLLY